MIVCVCMHVRLRMSSRRYEGGVADVECCPFSGGLRLGHESLLSATVKPPLLHATQDIRQRAERFSQLSAAAAQTAEREKWPQAIEEVCGPQTMYPNAFSCFVLAHVCACVCACARARACVCVCVCVCVHGDLAVLIGACMQANQALSICPHVQDGDAAVTQLRVSISRPFSMNLSASATANQSLTCLSHSLVSSPRLFALARAPPCRLPRCRMCGRSATVRVCGHE